MRRRTAATPRAARYLDVFEPATGLPMPIVRIRTGRRRRRGTAAQRAFPAGVHAGRTARTEASERIADCSRQLDNSPMPNRATAESPRRWRAASTFRAPSPTCVSLPPPRRSSRARHMRWGRTRSTTRCASRSASSAAYRHGICRCICSRGRSRRRWPPAIASSPSRPKLRRTLLRCWRRSASKPACPPAC